MTDFLWEMMDMWPQASAPAAKAYVWDGDGWEFGTTIYRGPGIPISGLDYPRPDDRPGWQRSALPLVSHGIILWRRRKDEIGR